MINMEESFKRLNEIKLHIFFFQINIHLFHDACNLKSVESEGPSIYVNFRQRALEYALDNIAGANTIHPVCIATITSFMATFHT